MNDARYYPFNAGNIKEEPRPLITTTYFNDVGLRNTNASGNHVSTAVGYGTNWPIGLLPSSIYDLWANVKMLGYHVNVAFLNSVDFDSGLGTSIDYYNMENLNAQGVLRRCFISSGTMFKNAFKSFPRKGSANSKATTDDILIDFTKSFYDLRQPGQQGKALYWFPYIKLAIAGQHGYITNGASANPAIEFQGMAIPSVPLEVRNGAAGIPILDPIVHRADFQIIERYDQITFTPRRAVAGQTEITITIPPYNTNYDSTEWRDGFADVTNLDFGGVSISTFTKVPNDQGVIESIRVTPPIGSRSDVIKFTSVANTDKPELTTDYYHTQDILYID